MKRHQTLAACMVAATLAAGCASKAPQPYASAPQAQSAQSESYGTIQSIELVQSGGESGSSGTGVVAGGLLGGLLGNQVGSGSGRTAATVAGAVGGALVGNEVEKNRTTTSDMYRINVRLDNGSYRIIVQGDSADLRVGNRVRVIDGHIYRQ